MLSNKDCCEGSCVHQELLGSGLRHGVHHHVAGWIRPRLQVTFFALLEDFYLDILAVKDRDKTHRITGVILIITSLLHSHLQLLLMILLLLIKISPMTRLGLDQLLELVLSCYNSR
jgi:hypothetical protein